VDVPSAPSASLGRDHTLPRLGDVEDPLARRRFEPLGSHRHPHLQVLAGRPVLILAPAVLPPFGAEGVLMNQVV
jgi:hypothetical protein